MKMKMKLTVETARGFYAEAEHEITLVTHIGRTVIELLEDMPYEIDGIDRSKWNKLSIQVIK